MKEEFFVCSVYAQPINHDEYRLNVDVGALPIDTVKKMLKELVAQLDDAEVVEKE